MMSIHIKEELILVLMSLYGGLVLAMVYDSLRIFRNIFKISIVRVIIEELIFWIIAAYFIFGLIIKYNYGRLRMYVVAGSYYR